MLRSRQSSDRQRFSKRALAIFAILLVSLFLFDHLFDSSLSYQTSHKEELRARPHEKIYPPPLLKYQSDFEFPKIALLFLTRGPMPLEPIWRFFFDAFPYDWRQFFSIYVHASPDFEGYHSDSLFAGCEIRNPVNVEWGQHSMVEAERRLYAAGLADSFNWQFVFLSDDAMPLYSALTTYVQFMSEKPRSRINICANESNPGERMVYRWQREMATVGLTRDLWRKSGQWKSLLRPHVKLVVEEKELNDVFSRECWCKRRQETGTWERFCISDEHYLPSLFALKGFEGSNEFACDGVSTYAHWTGNYYHPKIYGSEEASAQTLHEAFRKSSTCYKNGRPVLESRKALAMLDIWMGYFRTKKNSSDANLYGVVKTMRDLVGSDALETREPRVDVMGPECPLFARKIGSDAVEAFLSVYTNESLAE